jgi:hypothetical protein
MMTTKNYHILGFNTLQYGENSPTFRRNILPSTLGSKQAASLLLGGQWLD